jgi:hypothetical protein
MLLENGNTKNGGSFFFHRIDNEAYVVGRRLVEFFRFWKIHE